MLRVPLCAPALYFYVMFCLGKAKINMFSSKIREAISIIIISDVIHTHIIV